MRFDTAKKLIRLFLALGIVCCVGGLILQNTVGTGAVWLIWGAAASVAACVFVAAVGLRCPYCGRRIIRDCLVVKACPHCRRDLGSGLKVKAKKARRL